jgi:hypothetical protein
VESEILDVNTKNDSFRGDCIKVIDFAGKLIGKLTT